jgi:hypothetical protein
MRVFNALTFAIFRILDASWKQAIADTVASKSSLFGGAYPRH